MEENKRLKESLGAGGMISGGGSDPEAAKKLKEAEEQMARNQAMMDDMAKSYEARLNEAN